MPKQLSAILLFLVFVALAALQMQEANLHAMWRYERELMTAEPWRAFSHALLHLNYNHLILNLVALACMYFLFSPAFETGMWLIVLILSCALSALGMYLFSADVGWCVGLSGGLHGLFVYAVVRSQAHWVWLLAIILKIIDEQFSLLQQIDWLQGMQWLSASEQMIDGQVVVDAHLWGAIGGLLLLLLRASIKIKTFIEVSRS